MVYKYKDKSDAAKVHSAPATGRRVSYSRADNKTYRNTGGASTRAGAELRAKQTFGVPGTDGAEKKKVPQEACNQAICDCNNRPHDKR